MHPRRYALALISAGAGLFVAVAAANVIIDPHAVFGTGLVKTPNRNTRYLSFVSYQQHADRYDGLIFGSSRIKGIPTDELSRRMNGVNFANFSVSSGQILDHLLVLEFVVRQKAEKGKRLRAVFLLLDVDNLGLPSRTDKLLMRLLPPGLSGESAAVFWWKNITAIQVSAWTMLLRSVWRGSAVAEPVLQKPPPTAPAKPITSRPDFEGQLGLLERFVMICRDNNIRLVVALSPIHVRRTSFDDAELSAAVERVKRIVPAADFVHANKFMHREEGWSDDLHFTLDVGHRMLAIIFAD